MVKQKRRWQEKRPDLDFCRESTKECSGTCKCRSSHREKARGARWWEKKNEGNAVKGKEETAHRILFFRRKGPHKQAEREGGVLEKGNSANGERERRGIVTKKKKNVGGDNGAVRAAGYHERARM